MDNECIDGWVDEWMGGQMDGKYIDGYEVDR